jgi:hypothetical protein
LLAKIRAEKAISDGLAGELKAALTEFKQNYAVEKPQAPAETPKAAPTQKAKAE